APFDGASRLDCLLRMVRPGFSPQLSCCDTVTTPPLSTPPPQRTASTINPLRVLIPFAAAGTIIAAGLTFAAFAARYHWRLEHACHFRAQYFWSLLLAFVVLWAAKRPRIATLALVASLANFAAIVPIYWPTQQPPISGPKLRVISFN